jgi:hypothetical protein
MLQETPSRNSEKYWELLMRKAVTLFPGVYLDSGPMGWSPIAPPPPPPLLRLRPHLSTVWRVEPICPGSALTCPTYVGPAPSPRPLIYILRRPSYTRPSKLNGCLNCTLHFNFTSTAVLAIADEFEKNMTSSYVEWRNLTNMNSFPQLTGYIEFSLLLHATFVQRQNCGYWKPLTPGNCEFVRLLGVKVTPTQS